MPRPRGSKNKKAMFVNTLAEAVRFISCAQKPVGNEVDTHCMMFNNWIVATNGVVTAAHPLQDDIRACPHTMMLLAALDNCDAPFGITQPHHQRLVVTCGEFRAEIPCALFESLPMMAPDAAQWLVDGRLLDALGIVAPLVADNASTVVQAAVQLCGRSVRATDTEVILEAWHGIDMPPGILIPKAAANAWIKCGKKPIRFGYSAESLTLWYEDGSWIKTQLFSNAAMPDMDAMLNSKNNPWPVPKHLFEAAASITPFSTSGIVYFEEKGIMRTKNVDTLLLANVTVDGLPAGLAFKLKSLKLIAPHCKSIDFTSNSRFAMFFGESVRGIIAKYVTMDADEITDGDIPL